MKKTNSRQVSVSELRSHIGFWLRFVSNHVSHAFGRTLMESGVTAAEWVIMRQMYDQKEMSPSVLAELTGLTRGAVSKLIDRLLAKKLVTRLDRTDDRRFQSVSLSIAGRSLVPALAAIADKNDAAFFGILSLSEREALLEVLKKLVEANRLYQLPTQ
jgi:DNA-binding MarR family transcriptional regulator